MSSLRLPITQLALLVTAVLCVGCSISIHAGNGNPEAEQAYRQAISQPVKSLTAAASKVDRTCAGGSQPNPQQCYVNTNTEIASARAFERALRSVPTPPRFAKATADMLNGLSIFVQGLNKRNEGLAAHSATDYSASYKLIDRGLALQKTAFSEYPADAKVAG